MRRIALTFALAFVAMVPTARVSADQQSDRAVAQQIARNMKTSGELKDYRVGVKYQDGVAWLHGTVVSETQKITAERIARQTDGVEKVICKLDVLVPEPANELSAESEEILQTAASEPAPRRAPQRKQAPRSNMPVPYAASGFNGVQPVGHEQYMGPAGMGPQPMPLSHVPGGMGRQVNHENPQMPNYAWPSYAAYPNYAAISYPQQYSPSAWPYIGPFYPYPQVPLGWRKVTLEWDDGWWFLDFNDCKGCH